MVRTKNDYKSTLRHLLSHLDGVNYEKGHVFTEERLLGVTPEDVVEYFNVKAYGTSRPTDDDFPILARSSSLYHYKKSISSLMPNPHIPWNDISRTGNPTRSVQVNAMIKKVKRLRFGSKVPR